MPERGIPALAVGVAVWSFPKTAGWRRPDAIDIAAGAAAAAAFAMRPELLIKTGGGWLAPIILILGIGLGSTGANLRRAETAGKGRSGYRQFLGFGRWLGRSSQDGSVGSGDQDGYVFGHPL